MNRECTQREYTEQRDDSHSGGMGQDGGRFHHDIQNSTPFKTYELVISGRFHLMFPDHSSPQEPEPQEVKPQVSGEHCTYLDL